MVEKIAVKHYSCSMISITLGERILSRVVKMGDCLVWPGAKDPDGYGITSWDGIQIRVHRAAYHIFKGDIPKELGILHKCDNPGCVNPKHLYPGTAKRNAQDMSERGRSYCQNKPERCHTKLLNWEKVREIRRLYKPGVFGQYRLAKMFHVSRTAIQDIVKNRHWKVGLDPIQACE